MPSMCHSRISNPSKSFKIDISIDFYANPLITPEARILANRLKIDVAIDFYTCPRFTPEAPILANH